MFCARFTPVAAMGDGRVVDTGDSIFPATGRFVTIDLDDGRRTRSLHLDSRFVGRGDRVRRGQVIGLSGATGYGEEDWSWNVQGTGGAHVHQTLWPSQRYVFGSNGTLDPEPFFDVSGSAAGESAKPIPTEEEEIMSVKDDIISGVLAGIRPLLSAAVQAEFEKRGEYDKYTILPLADGDGGIWLTNTETDKRTHIASPYHVTLIQRYFNNNGSDPMLTAEYDIVRSYLSQVA